MSDVARTPPPPTPSPPQPAGPEPHRRGQDAAGAAEDSSQPSPSFEPLFTLLTNTTTNATVHPRVHYLFNDDDTSLLANAASDPSHRALVVDLAPSDSSASAPSLPAWSVSWASSLSSDFAVTGSSLAVQQGEGEGDGGAVMLRVEGVEREPVDLRGGDSLPNSGSGTVGREDVDALIDDFKRRMGVLKKVVGEGETRRGIVVRETQDTKAEVEETPGVDTSEKEEAKETE